MGDVPLSGGPQLRHAQGGRYVVGGVALVAKEMSQADHEELAAGIAKLACAREGKLPHFQQFTDWVRLAGPFSVVVDGANVGMYGMNFEGACFNFQQTEALMAKLRFDGIPWPGFVSNALYPPYFCTRGARQVALQRCPRRGRSSLSGATKASSMRRLMALTMTGTGCMPLWWEAAPHPW